MTAKSFLKKLIREDSGATAIEYGLIAALVVLAMMTALNGVADKNSEMWNHIKTKSAEAHGVDP